MTLSKAKTLCIWLIFSFVSMAWPAAQATTIFYRLENVILDDATQMTGTFSWTFDAGDFENGVGQFMTLYIPHTAHNQSDLNATIDAGQSIEITLPGSVHDDGVDITLVLAEPLTPTTSSLIDLIESRYEIGGNGFHTGIFLSGTIALVADSDADGVADNSDNCIDRPNASQLDSDADGIGNYCDGDFDNNCITTFPDLSIMQAGFFTIDPLLDLDSSGGPVNFIDLAIMQSLFFLPPGPSGTPNICN